MIAGFFVFFGFMAWAGARSSTRARDNARRMAGELGLELEAATPTLGIFYPHPRATGRIRGKAAALYNFTTGSGKSRRTWSALAVTPAATGGLTFKLSPQGFGTKLVQLFGAKEITVGNPGFDAAWFIQTNEPDFFRAALLPELQEKIRPCRGRFALEENQVTYVEEGTFADMERCRRMAAVMTVVGDLADVAEVFARTARRA